EAAAAAGAIIIRGDNEFLGRDDGLAVIHQIDDAAGVRIDLFLAIGGIFRGLGDVDVVGDPVDDVVIVGREVRIDESGILGALFGLVEDAGRTFEPVLHVGPGDDHGLDGVGVEIEIGNVLDRDRADRNIGV